MVVVVIFPFFTTHMTKQVFHIKISYVFKSTIRLALTYTNQHRRDSHFLFSMLAGSYRNGNKPLIWAQHRLANAQHPVDSSRGHRTWIKNWKSFWFNFQSRKRELKRKGVVGGCKVYSGVTKIISGFLRVVGSLEYILPKVKENNFFSCQDYVFLVVVINIQWMKETFSTSIFFYRLKLAIFRHKKNLKRNARKNSLTRSK